MNWSPILALSLLVTCTGARSPDTSEVSFSNVYPRFEDLRDASIHRPVHESLSASKVSKGGFFKDDYAGFKRDLENLHESASPANPLWPGFAPFCHAQGVEFAST